MASYRRQNREPSSIAPRVYQLAQLVYKEFETLRQGYGENSYARLLPLCLKILEEMDQLISDKQQLTVDLSMQVAEKNDVVFQLERAKKLRDVADKRVSSLEDELLVTKKAAEDKVERLESLLRHHEMLARNAKEHASRLEERDAQLQNELAIANDRYTELLRAHVDQLERIKLPYSDNASVLAAGAEATNQSEAKAEAIEQSMRNSDIRLPTKPGTDDDGYLKLDELPSTILLDPVKPSDKVSSFIDLMDEAMEYESVIAPSSAVDQEDDDEATHASEGTECAENSFGMVKEVEKLINENAELSATKNALNVVKNDLIRKLDDVTGEKLMLIKELEYLRANRDQNRNDVNRLVRQVNGYQKRVAYLSARLKLYEDVNESFELLPVSATLSHAASCLVLNDSSCSANELRGSTATVTSANRFGGSLDRVNLTSNHYNPYNAIDAYEARHVNGESQYADRPVDQTREAVPNTPVSQAMCMAKMGEPYFTKREMARVISERNHYKEAFLELQESVRYMEDMRAQSSAEERPSSAVPGNGRNGDRRSSFYMARRLFSSIHSVADGIANGLLDLFSDSLATALPSEVQDYGFTAPNRWDEDFSRTSANAGHSSELQHMFSHLLGHAVGQGTEAVLGTGNDFAASVTSQSLSSAIPHLLSKGLEADASGEPTPSHSPVPNRKEESRCVEMKSSSPDSSVISGSKLIVSRSELSNDENTSKTPNAGSTQT